jgi:hypothetical protein
MKRLGEGAIGDPVLAGNLVYNGKNHFSSKPFPKYGLLHFFFVKKSICFIKYLNRREISQ